jgi:hypothetical protein
MKAEMINYCKSIGLTEPFLKRMDEHYEMVIEVIKEEPVEVLIEDYVNEEGTRTYTDATFMSEHYVVAINQFLTSNKMLLHDAKQKIEGIYISKQDYDFKKATEQSRLNLEVIFRASNMRGNFKASKENCDFLWKITRDYFFPLMEIK